VENWLIFHPFFFISRDRTFFTSGGETPLGKKYSLDIKRRAEKANFPLRAEITILYLRDENTFFSIGVHSRLRAVSARRAEMPFVTFFCPAGRKESLFCPPGRNGILFFHFILTRNS
jgi:hypothetical protein